MKIRNAPWPILAVLLLLVALIVTLGLAAKYQSAPSDAPMVPANPSQLDTEIAPLPRPMVPVLAPMAPVLAPEPDAEPTIETTPAPNYYYPQRRGIFRRW